MPIRTATPAAMKLLMEGSEALARAEANGIKIDCDYLDKTIRKVSNRIRRLEEELRADDLWRTWRRDWGEKANLGSDDQLTKVLFDTMQLPYEGERTTTGRYRADEEVIGNVDLPFCKQWRRLKKLKRLHGTYLLGLKREVVDGLVHPVFNLHLVRSWRSSCDSPNIQNQYQRDPEFSKLIRTCYIARPGHVIVEVDYSMLEFRIASCVIGSTRIHTIDGEQSIKKVCRRVSRGDNVYVYGYDRELQRIAVSKVTGGGITREQARVWRVVLDNGETVTATADHKFLLRNGQYVELRDLQPGMSLMPFYKDTKRSSYGTCYNRIYLNNGLSMMAHNLIAMDVLGAEIAGSDKVVHHWDGNGTNNSLYNIEVMTRSKHMGIHAKQGWNNKQGRKKHLDWSNSEENKRMLAETARKRAASLTDEDREELSARMSESIKRRGGHGGDKNPMHGRKHSKSAKRKMSKRKEGYMPLVAGWNKGKTKETDKSVMKISQSKRGKATWNKGKKGCQVGWNKGLKMGPMDEVTKKKISVSSKGKPKSKETKHRMSLHRKKWWAKKKLEVCAICQRQFKFLPGHVEAAHGMPMKEYRKTHNHKVVSIEYAGREDVYNINVEGIHNYATAAGVVIKNCFWEDDNMIAYASDPAKDVHRDQCMRLFKCKAEQVSKPARHIAKNQFVFPTLYGSYYVQTAKGIWEKGVKAGVALKDGTTLLQHLKQQGITTLQQYEAHVKQVEQQFCEDFPGFVRGKEAWIAQYRKRGWFQILTGFICQGIYSNNDLLNYPVQGPGFHCLLWSMPRIQRRLDKCKLKTLVVGEIHDCILLDVPETELQDVLHMVKQVMTTNLCKAWGWLRTPMSIEVDVTPVGGAWGDKAPWTCDGSGTWRPKEAT